MFDTPMPGQPGIVYTTISGLPMSIRKRVSMIEMGARGQSGIGAQLIEMGGRVQSGFGINQDFGSPIGSDSRLAPQSALIPE